MNCLNSSANPNEFEIPQFSMRASNFAEFIFGISGTNFRRSLRMKNSEPLSTIASQLMA